ncbi:MAG: 16S rRNA (adenine(1518)-N(6)/adenine(1519)-N(6))-dimethyltransferase RsmA [Pseudomonadota bacterium]
MKAKKKFSQNFLVDQPTIDNITEFIRARPNQQIVEIGPGKGALTDQLARCGAQLILIEIDRDLAAALRARFQNSENVEVFQQDILETDFQRFKERGLGWRIVGNLPYHISSPILLRFLSDPSWFSDAIFMLQKEVVDRLCAEPGTKSYGRLTVAAQATCIISPGFEITPDAFDPMPRVISSLVRLAPRPQQPTAAVLTICEQLTRFAFSQRRKTIRNSVGAQFPLAPLEAAGIDVSRRPEEISVERYIAAAQNLLESRNPARTGPDAN